MLVAVVPNPVLLVGNGPEVLCAQVHGEAVEAKELSNVVGGFAVGGSGQALIVQSTLQVVHWPPVNVRIILERISELSETWNQVR